MWVAVGPFWVVFLRICLQACFGKQMWEQNEQIWGYKMCLFYVTVIKIMIFAKSAPGAPFLHFGDPFGRHFRARGTHFGCLGKPLAPPVEDGIWGRILEGYPGGPGRLQARQMEGNASLPGPTKPLDTEVPKGFCKRNLVHWTSVTTNRSSGFVWFFMVAFVGNTSQPGGP